MLVVALAALIVKTNDAFAIQASDQAILEGMVARGAGPLVKRDPAT